jgi:hypothetical protein
MASNYNNEISTIGLNSNMLVDPVAAVLRARAEADLTTAAQKAQEVLDAIDQGAERNEQVQINLFDFHDGGALVSKGRAATRCGCARSTSSPLREGRCG